MLSLPMAPAASSPRVASAARGVGALTVRGRREVAYMRVESGRGCAAMPGLALRLGRAPGWAGGSRGPRSDPRAWPRAFWNDRRSERREKRVLLRTSCFKPFRSGAALVAAMRRVVRSLNEFVRSWPKCWPTFGIRLGPTSANLGRLGPVRPKALEAATPPERDKLGRYVRSDCRVWLSPFRFDVCYEGSACE